MEIDKMIESSFDSGNIYLAVGIFSVYFEIDFLSMNKIFVTQVHSHLEFSFGGETSLIQNNFLIVSFDLVPLTESFIYDEFLIGKKVLVLFLVHQTCPNVVMYSGFVFLVH